MMAQMEAVATDGVRDVPKISAPHLLKYIESWGVIVCLYLLESR